MAGDSGNLYVSFTKLNVKVASYVNQALLGVRQRRGHLVSVKRKKDNLFSLITHSSFKQILLLLARIALIEFL